MRASLARTPGQALPAGPLSSESVACVGGWYRQRIPAPIGGIDASLKQRKGDPVQAELDSAMKRIGELTMQVELLEAKTETFGPLGRRRSRR